VTLARRTVLVLIGLVLLSFNLRPAAVSVGPVLEEVRDALGMSGPEAGLLTSLPVLAFAVFGALAPAFARAIGVHRAAAIALVAVVVGLGGRAAVGHEVTFLLLSAAALAGMATANVLLPSLVKLHFPHRIGAATAVYTTALATGLTSAFLLTVPISHAFDSWRAGLGVWAITALVALIPWLALATHDRHLEREGRSISFGEVARTRLGWAMALLFGLQSLQAYSIFGWFSQLWRDHGYAAGEAGAFVGIVAAVSIPMSLWLPGAVARRDNQVVLILSVLGCYLVGYGMLLVDAHAFALPAAVLIGIGCCIFPLVLTLIGLRAHTPDGTAALSGFTQSVGYLLAALGPFLVGTIYDATGSWTAPLWLLLALVLPLMAVGIYVGRPAYLEDQLRERSDGGDVTLTL
jgi:CP family cyanate transporter-like MFS transporter